MANDEVKYKISLQDLFSSKIKAATMQTERLNASVGKTQSLFNGLGSKLAGAFAVVGVGSFAKDVVMATASLEGIKNQLNFASGSAEQGGRDFEYIRERAKFLGLDLQTTAQAFAQLEGATRGTSIQGQKTRDVFEGVAMASTVMHLSAEASQGALYALQQMMSKGKVSAEELNGQLGERIPGAMAIAARSMNTTQASLMDLMKEGKVMSEDFLPKFAAQLKKEFSGGVDKARHSIQASLANISTAWFELKTQIGSSLGEAIPMILGAFRDVISMLSKTVSFIKENSTAFKALGIGLIAITTGYLAWNTLLKLNIWYNGLSTAAIIINTLATEGLSAAWLALNMAMSANPIGLIIVGIGSLIGLFYYLSERAGGLAEVFKALGTIMIGAFTLDSAMIMKGWDDLINGAANKAKALATQTSAIVANPLADAMGIGGAAGTPFTNSSNGLSGASSATTAANTKTKGGGTSLSAVETKGHQNFNISIDKLIETLSFNTTNIKESSAKVKEEMTKALLESVNDFQIMATQ